MVLANPQYASLPRDAKGLPCLERLLEQKGAHTIWALSVNVDCWRPSSEGSQPQIRGYTVAYKAGSAPLEGRFGNRVRTPQVNCHLKDILAGIKGKCCRGDQQKSLVSAGRRLQERKALRQFLAASSVLKHNLAKSPTQTRPTGHEPPNEALANDQCHPQGLASWRKPMLRSNVPSEHVDPGAPTFNVSS